MFPSLKEKASVTSIDVSARQWAIELEDRERARSGVPLAIARQTVARRLNIPPGTLESIRRGRGKGMRAWLVERIQAAFVNEIETEMQRLAHVLEMARRCGLDSRESEVGAVATELEALRSLIDQG